MTATQFFFKHAGYSYNPQTETRLQGRWRGAKALAEAEAFAKKQEWSFEWQLEEEDPRIVFGEPDAVNGPFYNPDNEFWCCVLRANTGDYADNRDGQILQSLGMIEAPSVEYRRVVEAELALEAL